MTDLRQGDPLSSSLFVLMMNSLNRLLAEAIELGVLRRLVRCDLLKSVSLYTYDVVIFCHPDESELCAVCGILEHFGEVLGLRTNFAKCSVSPIGCSEDEAAGAAGLMECQLAQFLVKYLGIPLSIRRLSAASFQPLGLDKKTLKQVNKSLRGFLWVGRAVAYGGHCHVNWYRVCRPLRLGGLGIPDLARTVTSLRFSKMELDVFTASTTMEVGDGESALFWEDKWLDGRSIKEMAPEVYALMIYDEFGFETSGVG
ncbi:uncharacterized protein [Lolium perenne]|uniref:uncharacterized protein n=1 Tax=Lolium perenne TaxID=4522 RepID=UPI003A990821